MTSKIDRYLLPRPRAWVQLADLSRPSVLRIFLSFWILSFWILSAGASHFLITALATDSASMQGRPTHLRSGPSSLTDSGAILLQQLEGGVSPLCPPTILASYLAMPDGSNSMSSH